MKVTDITGVEFSGGGKGWKVGFDETDKVLWLRQKPEWGVGHDIPEESLEVNAKGNYQFKKVSVPNKAVSQTKSMKADPLKTESIERQCALKVAEKLYCHSSEAGTPFDDELFDGIYMHSLKLLDPLIAEAIKEGAKLKT